MDDLTWEVAVMEPELERRLHRATKEQLVLLLQELSVRHPILLAEMAGILAQFSAEALDASASEIDNEATENWDFSGDDDDLVAFHPTSRPALPSLDLEKRSQQINSYQERLQHGEPEQSLDSDLLHLLQEAEVRADQHDYQGALDLYALVLDKRLLEQDATLAAIFDKALDEVMPFLETLLSEASSSIMFDTSLSLSPLLTPVMRRSWLERLFSLWLKRLDLRRVEEDIPEIMLDMAWNEDVALLHTLVQEELQQLRQGDHSNIVDFSRQYRVRALEKLLKELPHL
ncbi:MAG TPA: hypothetical protein VEL31_13580 [Ktedonobacteraceae bacterium]|nr:hypothetical protein [Ktedonobacteraceae bacterium]